MNFTAAGCMHSTEAASLISPFVVYSAVGDISTNLMYPMPYTSVLSISSSSLMPEIISWLALWYSICDVCKFLHSQKYCTPHTTKPTRQRIVMGQIRNPVFYLSKVPYQSQSAKSGRFHVLQFLSNLEYLTLFFSYEGLPNLHSPILQR